MAHALQKLNQDNQDWRSQPQRSPQVRRERQVFLVFCAPLRPPRLDYLY
jgi:hypothetical protein